MEKVKKISSYIILNYWLVFFVGILVLFKTIKG